MDKPSRIIKRMHLQYFHNSFFVCPRVLVILIKTNSFIRVNGLFSLIMKLEKKTCGPLNVIQDHSKNRRDLLFKTFNFLFCQSIVITQGLAVTVRKKKNKTENAMRVHFAEKFVLFSWNEEMIRYDFCSKNS